MYSFNNLRNYSYSVNVEEEEWDEILILILSGTNKPTMAAERTISLFKPIRVYQGIFNLKININLNEKINIKVTDNTGAPVYLRQFTPGARSNELTISTSGWSSGDYKITFTNLSGETIATGGFSIH